MAEAVMMWRAAEQALVDSLVQQGFAIAEWNKDAPGPADIRGVKHDRRMLIQVRTAMFPDIPPYLGPDEAQRLVQKAVMNGDEPWEVRTYLDSNLHAVGGFQWRFLLQNPQQ